MSKKQHLSRLAAPGTWPIKRKGSKWIAKPAPGAHSLERSMPLLLYIRDVLKLAFRKRNVKLILNQIQINGKVATDVKYSVGVFDVIALPTLNKYYRVILTELGKLGLIEISAEESHMLPLRVTKKMKLKGNKLQLSCSNGWTVLTDSADIKPRDTLIYDLKNSKIAKHLPLAKGATVFITDGTHIGKQAILQDIRAEGNLKKNYIALLVSGENRWRGSLDHIIAIGSGNSDIEVRLK